MMDELELLKKDWQKKEEQLPKLTYNDIYTMLWKKSSSIVKWILIISILEILLPQLLYLVPSMRDSLNANINNYYVGLTVVYYVGVIFFIYQFYRQYRDISVLDNAKNLMRKIIKTRRTVKYYVIYSLAMAMVTFLLFAGFIYFDDSFLLSLDGVAEQVENVSLEKLKISAMFIMIVGGLIFTVLLGGLYFLIYGLLLRKLNKNYSELKKLEV